MASRVTSLRRGRPGFGFTLALGLILLLAAGGARSQTIVIEPRFEQAGHFHEGVAPARDNGRWGFIDRAGTWVVPPRYDGVLKGGSGRFGIQENGRWGYVDTTGAVVVPPRYEDARPFGDGVAAVKQEGRWGFITAYGAIETPFLFEEIGGREGRFFTALSTRPNSGRKWHVFRAYPGGQPLDPADEITDLGESKGISIYSEAHQRWFDATRLYGFSEGAAVAQFEIGETLIGHGGGHGDLVLEEDETFSSSVRRRSEGWAAVQRDGVWGYINAKGKFLSPQPLEAAREFSMGVAPVKIGGAWGYMNKTGRIVLRPRFDDAYPFYEGFANVRLGEQRGFLKIAGDRITVFVEPKFEDVYRFQEGLAPVKMNGRWGFLAADGGAPPPPPRDLVDLLPE